jgi:hypothetical protein
MPHSAALSFSGESFLMNTGSFGTQVGQMWSNHMFSAYAGIMAPKVDLSIEGMRSQQFSVGVFFFMLVGVVVFSGIIYAVAFGRSAPKQMKTGEKVMFAAIILGTVCAVVFGGLQLLSGELF